MISAPQRMRMLLSVLLRRAHHSVGARVHARPQGEFFRGRGQTSRVPVNQRVSRGVEVGLHDMHR